MITRRVFLRRSASALAAGILVPQVLKAQTLGAAPSDQLRVALIGCKSMGWKDLTTFMKHAGVSCVALCDIDNNILESRADQARKLWGTRPETYTDYRRVLDRKDVDAVIIATPDHWHCLMMTDACAAGFPLTASTAISQNRAKFHIRRFLRAFRSNTLLIRFPAIRPGCVQKSAGLSPCRQKTPVPPHCPLSKNQPNWGKNADEHPEAGTQEKSPGPAPVPGTVHIRPSDAVSKNSAVFWSFPAGHFPYPRNNWIY